MSPSSKMPNNLSTFSSTRCKIVLRELHSEEFLVTFMVVKTATWQYVPIVMQQTNVTKTFIHFLFKSRDTSQFNKHLENTLQEK